MLQDNPEVEEKENEDRENNSSPSEVDPEPESAGRRAGLSASTDYDASPDDVPSGRKSPSTETIVKWRDFADINYAITFDELRNGLVEILGENFRLAPSGKVKSGKRRWVEDEQGRKYFGATTNRDLLLQIVKHFEGAGPAGSLNMPRTDEVFPTGSMVMENKKKSQHDHLESLAHLAPFERWKRFAREEKSIPVETFHQAIEELLGSGFTLELASHDPEAMRMVRDSSGRIVAQDRTNQGLLERIVDYAQDPEFMSREQCDVQSAGPDIAQDRLAELIPPTERSVGQYGERIPKVGQDRWKEFAKATKRVPREKVESAVRELMGREYEFFQRSKKERGVRNSNGEPVLTAKTNSELLSKVMEHAKTSQQARGSGDRTYSEVMGELRAQKEIHEHKLNEVLQALRDRVAEIEPGSRFQVEIREDGQLELKIMVEV
ncbi:MAG: hypothetical protein ACLFQR_04510 [Desulfovibrionales bacterium]